MFAQVRPFDDYHEFTRYQQERDELDIYCEFTCYQQETDGVDVLHEVQVSERLFMFFLRCPQDAPQQHAWHD